MIETVGKIIKYPLIIGIIIYAAFKISRNLNTTEIKKGDNICLVVIIAFVFIIGIFYGIELHTSGVLP